jgi:predicted amidohydrolase YtcJ
MKLVSSSTDPTNFYTGEERLTLGQAISASESGESVGITVDFQIEAQDGKQTLDFSLQKGNLNGSVVRVYKLEEGDAQLVLEVDHRENSGSEGINPLDFYLDLSTMTPKPATAFKQEDAPSAENAITIFYNGILLTIEESQPRAEAIAVQGEKILAVGSSAQILELSESDSVLIDLGGKTLMPGFVDAHNHFLNLHDIVPLNQASDFALERGITTMANLYVDQFYLEEIQEFNRQGMLRVRTSLYLNYNDACGVPMGDWYLEYPPTRNPGELLRIGGVKMYTDGGSCNVPAVSFDYPGGVGKGDLYFTQSELNEMITTIHENGYQMAIHAIGDRAIDQVMNAIEVLLQGAPNTLRHRIEHNAVLSPDMMPRYSQIGIVPVIFANFATCSKLGHDTMFKYAVPELYKTWEWPWRALIDTNPGLPIAWHTDGPWVTSSNSMYQLFGFVTRAEVAEDGSTCVPPDWLAANAITVEEALQIMTINSAFALFREEEVGSLKPGKYADLIILSDNPTSVDPYAIKDIDILMTMVGGRVEFCTSGQESICP